MESVIAYTDRLWKSLRQRPPRARAELVETRGRLAPWMATLTRFEGRAYAIAVAENSGLSLVFEISTVNMFKPAMVAALQASFEDLDLPVSALAAEVADIEAAPFVRLRNPLVLYELHFIEGICGSEFSGFRDNLRRVQRHLNNSPRQRQVPHEPRLAAPLLFAVHPASDTQH